MRAARLVLFAGQSNMLGHVRATGGEKPLHPDVLAWTNEGAAGRWVTARLGEPPFHPHPDRPNSAALHFALAVRRLTEGRVYLLGRAVNGASILSWAGPGAHHMARLAEEVSFALESEELRRDSIDAVDTFLWHQGESDDPAATMVKEPRLTSLEDYEAAFAAMIEALRARSWWRPSTKVVAGELVEEGWLSARNDFYRDRRRWPTGLNMAVASSRGLGHVGDRAHFDGPALQRLGERMAESWQILEADRAYPAPCAPVAAGGGRR